MTVGTLVVQIFPLQSICFLILTSSLPSLSGEPFLLQGTEIFAPLPPRSVLVNGATIFLVDRTRGRLLFYDGEGFRQLAGKGDGPGELMRPQGLFRGDGVVYLIDRFRLHVFGLAGGFRTTMRLPPGTGWEKVAGGWVGIQGLDYGQRDNPLELVFFDENLAGKSVLNRWSSEKERNPHLPEMPIPGVHNPVADFSVSWAGPSGAFVYTKLSGGDEVIITDISKKKTVARVKPDGKPSPFDRDWGEQFMADFNRRYNGKLKGDFPEFMPLIHKIWVTPEDHLVISKWPARPPLGPEFRYEKKNLRIFDQFGKPIPNPSIFDLNFWRVLHLDEARVAVNVFNAERDEYTLMLGSRDAFERIIASYPYLAP